MYIYDGSKYTEEEIQKVWGGNFFRVFKEVEEHAKTKS